MMLEGLRPQEVGRAAAALRPPPAMGGAGDYIRPHAVDGEGGYMRPHAPPIPAEEPVPQPPREPFFPREPVAPRALAEVTPVVVTTADVAMTVPRLTSFDISAVTSFLLAEASYQDHRADRRLQRLPLRDMIDIELRQAIPYLFTQLCPVKLYSSAEEVPLDEDGIPVFDKGADVTFWDASVRSVLTWTVISKPDLTGIRTASLPSSARQPRVRIPDDTSRISSPDFVRILKSGHDLVFGNPTLCPDS